LKSGGHTLSDGLAMLHNKETVLTAPLSEKLKEGVNKWHQERCNVYITVDAEGTDLNEAQIVTLVTSALDAKEARKPVSRKEMTNVLIDNAIMFWHDGTQYRKDYDHGRSLYRYPMSVSKKSRDGRRNTFVAILLQRSATGLVWENLPKQDWRCRIYDTADAGMVESR